MPEIVRLPPVADVPKQLVDLFVQYDAALVAWNEAMSTEGAAAGRVRNRTELNNRAVKQAIRAGEPAPVLLTERELEEEREQASAATRVHAGALSTLAKRIHDLAVEVGDDQIEKLRPRLTAAAETLAAARAQLAQAEAEAGRLAGLVEWYQAQPTKRHPVDYNGHGDVDHVLFGALPRTLDPRVAAARAENERNRARREAATAKHDAVMAAHDKAASA